MKEKETQGKRKRGRVLLITGLSMIAVALLALAGVFSYIYYTDRVAAGAQRELQQRWDEEPAAGADVVVGDGIARIKAPRLGLDAIVVELTGLDDADNLKRGPGHLPGTAYPGQPGNVVISGHRTTYGAPFKYINELAPGDEIILETPGGIYTYKVYEQRIVQPTDLTVLEQEGEPKVTLTACHPWYSASQRIVVIAALSE